MYRRPFLLVSLATCGLLTGLCTGCGDAAIGKPLPPVPLDVMQQAAAGETEFACALYAELSKGHAGENVFISPHSIYSVLAMAAAGADGETASQLAEALHVSSSATAAPTFDATHQGLAGLTSSLQSAKGDGAHQFLVANGLWVAKQYPIAAGFKAALDPYFHAGGGVYACDFANKYDSERTRIDNWCDEHTNGRITQIMPKLSPNEAKLLSIVLTNAVYFEGKWKSPFDVNDTTNGAFAATRGEQIVDLMNSYGHEGARYGAVDAEGNWFDTPAMYSPSTTKESELYPAHGCSIAELPYKGDRLSMVLIVPRDAAGLAAIEPLLTAERLNAWLTKLESRELAHLQMPKLDLATDYNLTATLKAMGMASAFTNPLEAGGANFSKITTSTNPNEQLYLGMVLHKATLEVDETGTVAAAVTAGLMPMAAAAPPTDEEPFRPNLIANKPFVLLIRDQQTGAVLFMGRIEQVK